MKALSNHEKTTLKVLKKMCKKGQELSYYGFKLMRELELKNNDK